MRVVSAVPIDMRKLCLSIDDTGVDSLTDRGKVSLWKRRGASSSSGVSTFNQRISTAYTHSGSIEHTRHDELREGERSLSILRTLQLSSTHGSLDLLYKF